MKVGDVGYGIYYPPGDAPAEIIVVRITGSPMDGLWRVSRTGETRNFNMLASLVYQSQSDAELKLAELVLGGNE